jgi:hypothetical protein
MNCKPRIWNSALKTWHALVTTTQRTTQNLKILRDEMVSVRSKVARTSIATEVDLNIHYNSSCSTTLSHTLSWSYSILP